MSVATLPILESVEISIEEMQRLETLLFFEKEARQKGFLAIGGVDEAGRGPLAGPVVAAACLFPEGLYLPGVDDSKKLTPAKRDKLFDAILSDGRIHYGIGVVGPEEIDRINIYQATIQAMLKAIEQLACRPDCLLVDGMNLPHPSIPCFKIIGGDGKSQSIAAASILAKVTRDRLMTSYHEQWPLYGFQQHKGYGTAQHLKAIEEHGPCPIHRLSFEPLKGYSTASQATV